MAPQRNHGTDMAGSKNKWSLSIFEVLGSNSMENSSVLIALEALGGKRIKKCSLALHLAALGSKRIETALVVEAC